MNVLQAFLDDRENNSPTRKRRARADSKKENEAWLLADGSPEARLLKFDSWVIGQLAGVLVWPEDEAKRTKLLGQCRAALETMFIHLYGRGWLLDGQRLARHVHAVLEPIGKAQRAGKVRDFWPYFTRAVSTYVGANAEEIQAEAKRAGAIAGNVLSALGITKGSNAATTVELVAQRREDTLREKVSRERKKQAQREADKSQLPLL